MEPGQKIAGSCAGRIVQFFLAGLVIAALTSCGSGYRPAFPFSNSLNKTSVFMGDSITEGWPLPDHNEGVYGQTTAQMLARFQVDVIGHGYKRVIILGGTNDVNIPQVNVSDISVNLDAMASMAEASGIEVILCKLPPIFRDSLTERLTTANQDITNLAQSKGLPLVDYFTPLSGHPEFFKDGVHPNAMGYALMEDALSQVVTK